jgi:hypothetical protein
MMHSSNLTGYFGKITQSSKECSSGKFIERHQAEWIWWWFFTWYPAKWAAFGDRES